MRAIVHFLGSPIGRKVVNGLTGFFLVAFLIGHLAANFLIFKSRPEYNGYGETLLKSWLIYPAEAGIAACFLYHAVNATLMVLRNFKSRPTRYQSKRDAGHTSRRGLASKTMIWTGLLVGAFFVFHIITMKFGEGFGTEKRDLFGLVVKSFSNPGIVGFYVVMMLLLGFHLWHGLSTVYESFGIGHRTYLRRLLQLGVLAIAGGFLSIPVLVFIFGGRL